MSKDVSLYHLRVFGTQNVSEKPEVSEVSTEFVVAQNYRCQITAQINVYVYKIFPFGNAFTAFLSLVNFLGFSSYLKRNDVAMHHDVTHHAMLHDV